MGPLDNLVKQLSPMKQLRDDVVPLRAMVNLKNTQNIGMIELIEDPNFVL
jgi:hypothetical protein